MSADNETLYILTTACTTVNNTAVGDFAMTTSLSPK